MNRLISSDMADGIPAVSAILSCSLHPAIIPSLSRYSVKTRILAQFGSLKEKLSELNVYYNILVQAELKWAEIAIEYILMPRERLSGFPFVLPYYEILIRAIEIKKLLKKIIDWNAETKMAVSSVLEFYEKIEKLVMTEDEIKEAKKLIKPYHNEYLVSSDPKRITILTDFIKLLEQNEENKNVDVKGWLNQFEKSNGLMTP
jgi:hypothetical protein